MKYHIDTMVCGGCVRSVTKIAQSVDSTAILDADVGDRTVDISSQRLDEITNALADAGFKATLVNDRQS